jgi:hypothetical protein
MKNPSQDDPVTGYALANLYGRSTPVILALKQAYPDRFLTAIGRSTSAQLRPSGAWADGVVRFVGRASGDSFSVGRPGRPEQPSSGVSLARRASAVRRGTRPLVSNAAGEPVAQPSERTLLANGSTPAAGGRSCVPFSQSDRGVAGRRLQTYEIPCAAVALFPPHVSRASAPRAAAGKEPARL